MNLAFRHTIPPISAKLKTNTHEKLAFYRTTTTVKRNFQRTAHSILQVGAFTERYTRQSETIIKANTLAWESCRPVTPILHSGSFAPVSRSLAYSTLPRPWLSTLMRRVSFSTSDSFFTNSYRIRQEQRDFSYKQFVNKCQFFSLACDNLY